MPRRRRNTALWQSAPGDGIASAFRDLGVDGIIQGGQTMNPSTEDILREIQRTPSEVVFVFPNNKNIIMAAEQTVALCEEKQVIVLPSKTIPQGITALLSFDPRGRGFRQCGSHDRRHGDGNHHADHLCRPELRF